MNIDFLLFVQLIGILMGTRAAPTIANILMGAIDLLVLNCSKTFGKAGHLDLILFFKRFIDDIILIWTGTVEE